MRLYPGFDGMAANGLRYGAAVELRENFGAADRTFANTTTGGVANSPSANTSAETVFVRRAFTYLASDKVGLVRFGQTDGVIGLFDPCIFYSGCWDAGVGNFNGRQIHATDRRRRGVPFVWLAQAGADYGNSKIVYLSPQFFGFDFGVQYAPNDGQHLPDNRFERRLQPGFDHLHQHLLRQRSDPLAEPGWRRPAVPAELWPGGRQGLWLL